MIFWMQYFVMSLLGFMLKFVDLFSSEDSANIDEFLLEMYYLFITLVRACIAIATTANLSAVVQRFPESEPKSKLAKLW